MKISLEDMRFLISAVDGIDNELAGGFKLRKAKIVLTNENDDLTPNQDFVIRYDGRGWKIDVQELPSETRDEDGPVLQDRTAGHRRGARGRHLRKDQ